MDCFVLKCMCGDHKRAKIDKCANVIKKTFTDDKYTVDKMNVQTILSTNIRSQNRPQRC